MQTCKYPAELEFCTFHANAHLSRTQKPRSLKFGLLAALMYIYNISKIHILSSSISELWRSIIYNIFAQHVMNEIRNVLIGMVYYITCSGVIEDNIKIEIKQMVNS
jgi:hypothetical protein